MKSAKSQRGFTLLEMLVVLGLIALIAPYIAPDYVMKLGERRSDVIIAETAAIYAAASNHRNINGEWPGGAACATAISELTTNNFLAGVDDENPFGGNITTSCTVNLFSIVQETDPDFGDYIAAGLPSTNVSNAATGEIVSSFPVPALESALDTLLDLAGTRAMVGNLNMGGNDIVGADNINSDSITSNTANATTINSTDIYTVNITATGSATAPEFRDSDNPAYVVDPSGTSTVNRLEADGDIRAPRYYDSDNLSYYVDPASESVLNSAEIGVAQLTDDFVEGQSCTTGQVGTTATGELLACVSGTWTASDGSSLTMISPRTMANSSGRRGWTTYNASSVIPAGAKFAMVQGEGFFWGPDCRSSSCKPYAALRERSGRPGYILMRGLCAGGGDICGISGTSFVPLDSNRRFQWAVVGSQGFHLGYTLRLIGYM